jgi:hypothetical protein
MASIPCISLRIPRAAQTLDCSDALIWDKIAKGELAFFRDGGITRVISDWIGEPPPREGRAPSIREYIAERLAATATTPRKRMPRGVHRGRPRRSVAAEPTSRFPGRSGPRDLADQ